MVSIGERRFFHPCPTFEHLCQRSHCSNLKFKRAFQFLQLLLIQRVYGIDVISCTSSSSPTRRQTKHQHHQNHRFQVFLGGSCNPTTWRHDQAIPYFQSRSVSFYNPQVSDWTPDLVEIEHRAKELAPLLFFVIDPDTRSLASMVEVCYLASLGRNIIVVMNPLIGIEHTKFIQQKKIHNQQEDEEDYDNVCETRQTLLTLLRSINVPVFDNVRLALECAAFILETTNRTIERSNTIHENDSESNEDREENPFCTPPPADGNNHPRAPSIVVIRSLSNKRTYRGSDEFFRQMQQSMPLSPPPLSRRHSTESNTHEYQLSPDSLFVRSLFLTGCRNLCHTSVGTPTTQLSYSTNESDDDGYGSLSSSDRALSASTSSIISEFESCVDHQREEGLFSSTNSASTSLINHLISSFTPYVPFVSPTSPTTDSSVSHSLFGLLTLPFRFIKNALLSPSSESSCAPTVPSPSQEPVHFDTTIPSSPTFNNLFDIYIAAGEYDQCWLNTFAIPLLDEANVSYTKRSSNHEEDQLDIIYDNHVRKRSRLLYYLINDNERLSPLATELAFLIGERKHHIVIYLQETISDEKSMSPCERRDIQRSRKYLEDLAEKDNIKLYHSREQSWEHVLAFFLQD